MSMSCAWQRAQQGACSIPKNLHPDADEEKGGKPKNDAHTTFADDRSEATGEAVAKVDAHCHERRGNYRGENREKVGAKWGGSFAPRVMAMEIDPGPTVSGRVNG